MELLSVAAVALQLHVVLFVPHFLTQPLSFQLAAAYEAPE
jgi:hypothetical protein